MPQYSKSSERSSLPFLSKGMAPGTNLHKRFLWYLAGKDHEYVPTPGLPSSAVQLTEPRFGNLAA